MIFGRQDDTMQPASDTSAQPTTAPVTVGHASPPLDAAAADDQSLPGIDLGGGEFDENQGSYLNQLSGDTPSGEASPQSPAPAVQAPAQQADLPAHTSHAKTGSLPHDNQPNNSAAEDDLLQLKQQALSELTPLVGHLDQTPEERFRTTMMMIQSADNQTLIKDAYTAAQGIQDDKARAQALLDVINEINYFTQQQKNG